MSQKTISLGQILTEEEMNRALKLFKECDGYHFVKQCTVEIISPILDRINLATGQENDPRYLAYCIQYAITKSHQLHS